MLLKCSHALLMPVVKAAISELLEDSTMQVAGSSSQGCSKFCVTCESAGWLNADMWRVVTSNSSCTAQPTHARHEQVSTTET